MAPQGGAVEVEVSDMADMKAMARRCACALLAAGLMMAAAGACAQTAVVDNGSDPNSKLNMRKEPSRDSSAIGQFYSGTQVEIVSDAGGGWSEVSIGGGQNSIGGYMMSDYLKSDASGVLDATQDKQVTSPYGTQSVVLRDRPSDSYDAVAMLTVGDDVTVIGVSGDFYYVLMNDNSVGCLSSDEVN